MNKKEVLFESRVDLWRAYRDEISKEASKFSTTEDKRLQKIKKEIRLLDPTILDSINVDIGVSSGISANINFSDRYSKLSFSMEGVDERLLEDLNNAVNEANTLKDQDFVIDKNYELLDLKLPRAYFITQIIPERNEIVLGEYEELAKKKVELVECKFAIPLGELVGKELIGRPRFSSIGALGMIVQEEDKVYFEYNVDNVQNAPGQHLVIYSGDFVLGGGMIKY